MTYFRKFSTLVYDRVVAQNILTAVLPSRLNVDRVFVYQNYRVSDGETPESVADKLYKDAKLYWVLLVVNDIVDPFVGWPMSDAELEEFVVKKWGALHAVHHFFDNRIGRICDDVDDAAYRAVPPASLPFYIVPVTCQQWERTQNDERRDVIAINPRYINQFVEAYNNALEGKE
ncbi:baseplate wedge subunit [Acidovorax phage ACP17]|uniref:Baseplate wedge subunit n=1 Tax=Acidovorax phage ACP17 TaxID=2010329 RepID=A0A218M3G8_9CAUD|nr:baseplate wedge subunit [Acidovorax phage ACP17]ASD50578.1 baseplate wedge subunit [Acidovorax phage ACP17]